MIRIKIAVRNPVGKYSLECTRKYEYDDDDDDENNSNNNIKSMNKYKILVRNPEEMRPLGNEALQRSANSANLEKLDWPISITSNIKNMFIDFWALFLSPGDTD